VLIVVGFVVVIAILFAAVWQTWAQAPQNELFHCGKTFIGFPRESVKVSGEKIKLFTQQLVVRKSTFCFSEDGLHLARMPMFYFTLKANRHHRKFFCRTGTRQIFGTVLLTVSTKPTRQKITHEQDPCFALDSRFVDQYTT